MDIIDDFLTVCRGTARAPPIITKQKNGLFKLRAQVHIIMTMPPGAGKTSGMMDDMRNVVPGGDMSGPGLLGTINGKSGDFVPGACTLAAGKVLWLDEYQRMHSKVREKLLSLIETSHTERSLGFNLTDSIHRKTKYGYVQGKKGTGHIEICSRFSCMLTGTIKPQVRQENYMMQGAGGEKAWMDAIMFLQRFVHVNMALDEADFYKVISGERMFNVKDYSQYYIEPIIMDDYLDIVKWHQELTSGEDFRFLDVLPMSAKAFKTRNCLDVVRMEAMRRSQIATLGKSGLPSWENTKKHIAYALFNVLANSLTFSEYTVFMNMISDEPKTQEQVARTIGISQQAVSKIEKKLIEYKLLDSNKNVEEYNLTTEDPPLE